jgi:DnaK suppressor protein
MDKAEQAKLRQAMIDRLTQIVRTVHADIDAVRVASLFDREPRDVGDDGARDQEVDMTSGLSERDREQARQIQDALARIRDGSYGKCVEDDKEIPIERLRAIPWAERCAEHQALIEGKQHHSTL